MKQVMKNAAVATVALLLSGVAAAQDKTPLGEWSGTASLRGGVTVPVELVLRRDAQGRLVGSFVNGKESNDSSSGELTGNHLVLGFDYFARKLEGDFADGTFTGSYGGARGGFTQLTLHPGAPSKPTAEGPKIDGDWEIAVKSPKGESAWTLKVWPNGPGEIKAAILRIDGDTGGLYGGYDPVTKEYRVSRFGASGAQIFGLKPQDDGTLLVEGLSRAGQQWPARRVAEARKENLAPPTKDTEQTSLQDLSKPLAFAGTDLNGNTLTNDDARFKGKVVIVAIGGSWCPNCHDEAPFLVELYKQYHAKGLEIVDLSFEEDDQLKNPTRLRAFQAKYGIPYPILVEGTPDQLAEKLPQGKNLNCWPTAFFVGRDGLVKEVHAGFSGPATGAAYTELKAETEKLLTQLLAAKATATTAKPGE